MAEAVTIAANAAGTGKPPGFSSTTSAKQGAASFF
jgi:hypothetical protein